MLLPVLMGIEGVQATPEELALIREVKPAGFVLFSRNIESPEQTRALTDSLRDQLPHIPIIAVDQEGGRVIRTSSLELELPAAGTLAATGNSAFIAEAADITAQSLLMLGINFNFAPVLDICHDETVRNALPGRCWGGNESSVISYAGMFNRNMVRAHLHGCGKHFPGMGRANVDPHHDLPVIDASLEELLRSDFIPFSALAPELSSIMTAHILLPQVDPELPASLSPVITRQLLRNQMGYDGIVITDDLCMGAISTRYGIAQSAIMALEASCDLPIICHSPLPHVREFARLLESGNNTVLVHDASIRIERLIKKFSTPPRFNQSLWNGVLEKAAQLCRQTNSWINETPASSAASPVNFM